MTRDDIIRMAREAGLGDTGVQCGFVFFQPGADGLERFFHAAYAAGAVAEREVCARICLEEAPTLDGQLCAAAIRARSEK